MPPTGDLRLQADGWRHYGTVGPFDVSILHRPGGGPVCIPGTTIQKLCLRLPAGIVANFVNGRWTKEPPPRFLQPPGTGDDDITLALRAICAEFPVP